MNENVVTIVTGGSAGGSDSETVTVTAGHVLEGWMDVSITLRAEAFPNDWSLTASSASPIDGRQLAVQEGDHARILIDDEPVVTGYVDRVTHSGQPVDHRVVLTGRGKTQDLVDCSAEWSAGGQIMAATALEIAEKLAEPYKITVALADGADAGPIVDQFNLNYGETAADIIQRVTRNAGLIAYENAEGELILARIGAQKAASAVVYGRNVERYDVTHTMDQRVSEVVCASQGQDVWGELGDGGFFFATETDPGVKRHRRIYLVQELSALGPELTKQKAKWEIARRSGRATSVEVTVDSWRDGAGKLWAPNTLVPVQLPGLRTDDDLCIAEATFIRNSEEGTVARLFLLPRQAFTPEPISLQPVNINDVSPA